MNDPRYAKLADLLINYSCDLQAGEHILLDLVEFLQDAQRQGFLAEISLIEGPFEDDLVHPLQLGQREFFGQQFKPDRLPPDFALQPGQGLGKDAIVVEGQGGQVVDREPGGIAGVGGGLDPVIAESDQGIMGHGHHPLPGIPVEVAKGRELFQEHPFESGFLAEFPAGRLVDRLVETKESAGQRPTSAERIEVALDQQDLQIGRVEAEDHAVDGHCGPGVLIGERHLGVSRTPF